MSVGIRAKNDFGHYTINTDYRNAQLTNELSVSDGVLTIPINKVGIPIIAVKGGAGLIKSVSVSNGFCKSVTIYTISFGSKTDVRIYSYPEKHISNEWGMSAYTSSGDLAYTSTIDTMRIRENSYISYDYSDGDQNGNFAPPVGWVGIGSIDIGVQGPCPIIYYKSVSVFSGEWLVIGSGVCESGGGSDMYNGGAPIMNHGNSTPAMGIKGRNLTMGLNDDLVVSHHHYGTSNFGYWFFAFFSVHMNVITLDD